MDHVLELESDGSFELVAEPVDEAELPPTKRQVQLEGKHRAMAMPPPGGDGDDPGRDRRAPQVEKILNRKMRKKSFTLNASAAGLSVGSLLHGVPRRSKEACLQRRPHRGRPSDK